MSNPNNEPITESEFDDSLNTIRAEYIIGQEAWNVSYAECSKTFDTFVENFRKFVLAEAHAKIVEEIDKRNENTGVETYIVNAQDEVLEILEKLSKEG